MNDSASSQALAGKLRRDTVIDTLFLLIALSVMVAATAGVHAGHGFGHLVAFAHWSLDFGE